MKAIDTNVLARLVLRDDQEQAEAAAVLLGSPVWVTVTVWLELGWVLGKQLKLDRQVIGDALETLLGLETVHTDDRDRLHWAVRRFRAGADWADMIHLVAATGHADAFCTFDARFPSHAGSAAPMPVEYVA